MWIAMSGMRVSRLFDTCWPVVLKGGFPPSMDAHGARAMMLTDSAENRPDTSQVAKAINEGTGLP